MMKSKKLSLYLKGKITPNEIKSSIYSSLNERVESFEMEQQPYISDQGHKLKVTALQFLNLLNDFINGNIDGYELFYILNAIEQSRDLIVENPGAIEILYQLASQKSKNPIGINYIKSMIYRP